MKPRTDATQEMPTLSQCVNKAVADGFVENFKIDTNGLTTETEDKYYSPAEAKISNFYRFEGYSDPGDNSILYLMETTDGRKGILLDAYGVDADMKVSNFIRRVEDVQKKAKT